MTRRKATAAREKESNEKRERERVRGELRARTQLWHLLSNRWKFSGCDRRLEKFLAQSHKQGQKQELNIKPTTSTQGRACGGDREREREGKKEEE